MQSKNTTPEPLDDQKTLPRAQDQAALGLVGCGAGCIRRGRRIRACDRECLLVVADHGQAAEGDAEVGSFWRVIPVVVEVCFLDDAVDGPRGADR